MRLTAVRGGCTQQSDAEWFEAARSFGKGLGAALNALNPSKEVLKFYRDLTHLSGPTHEHVHHSCGGFRGSLASWPTAPSQQGSCGHCRSTPAGDAGSVVSCCSLARNAVPSRSQVTRSGLRSRLRTRAVSQKTWSSAQRRRSRSRRGASRRRWQKRPERWRSVQASPHHSSLSWIAEQP